MRAVWDHAGSLHSWAFRLLDGVGDAVTAGVVLFVLGTVLIALLPARMEKLELEVASRPARAFALGLVGFVIAFALAVALCVTVIGIPIAAAGALLAVLGAYAGIVAVLRTLGAALIRHRTENRYLHLALGCALFLVAGAVPWLGDCFTFVVGLVGFGTVIGTRAAGLLRQNRNSSYATI